MLVVVDNIPVDLPPELAQQLLRSYRARPYEPEIPKQSVERRPSAGTPTHRSQPPATEPKRRKSRGGSKKRGTRR